jgi:hypothetical protein
MMTKLKQSISKSPSLKRKTSSRNSTTISSSHKSKVVAQRQSSRQKVLLKSVSKKMSPRSAKAKGRKLQTWVVEKLLSVFKRLTSLDVRSTPMGVNGVDVQLSTSAYRKFPYNIECKNTERIRTIYNYYEQAISHDNIEKEGEPLLIIKMNRQKPLVVVDAEHFIELVSCQNKK